MLFHTVLEVVGELVYLDGEELVQGVIDVVVQDLFNSIDAFPNGFPQGEVVDLVVLGIVILGVVPGLDKSSHDPVADGMVFRNGFIFPRSSEL